MRAEFQSVLFTAVSLATKKCSDLQWALKYFLHELIKESRGKVRKLERKSEESRS